MVLGGNSMYVSVYSQSNMQMFCLKKLISQHWGVQKSPFLEEMTLTQYILRYICFWTPQVPPICLKTPKCAIFSTFWESHLKHTPKVGVHRENLLIGNVAQTVFGGFYICWDYVISFSQHFPMRKFSPSPPTSPSPLSHWNSENWLKFGKIFFFNFSKKKKFFFQNIQQSICTMGNVYDF